LKFRQRPEMCQCWGRRDISSSWNPRNAVFRRCSDKSRNSNHKLLFLFGF
jgi:hypothetical protein